MTTRVITVDTGCANLSAAEHLAHQLDEVLGDLLAREDDGGYLVSSHVVPDPSARIVLAVAWTGEPEVAEVAARVATATGAEVATEGPAADQHRTRTAGRLVRYRGRRTVERPTTVAAVVAASVIDAVEGLAGTEVAPDSPVDLSGFARPVWRPGRCVLLVEGSSRGLAAFEKRHQIACCADH